MGISWGRRGGTAPVDRLAAPAPGPAQGDVIDLRAPARPVEPLDDAAIAARLAELRARSERREAERELLRLRARHWSGERVVEEGRRDLEWWEHAEADPYAVLGLLPGASLEQASAARRAVARRCHPDRLHESDEREQAEALRRLVAANSAYERLRRALRPI